GVENPLPKAWKRDDDPIYPGIALALSDRQSTSEVWNHEKEGLMRIGVAPLVDSDANVVTGAIIVAYSMTALKAQEQQGLLGADVVYFHGADGAQRYATSFTRTAGEEDTQIKADLSRALATSDLGATALSEGLAP